jgi:hypothetical protein
MNELKLSQWIETAEKLKPKLNETIIVPVAIVQAFPDSDPFRRWKLVSEGCSQDLEDYLMTDGDSVILDFGNHLTGHFSIAVRGEGRGVDSPARLKMTFGEIAAEVIEPFDPYQGGLSRAWLQDETVNIDVLPSVVKLPRRYSFRYVKIEVVAVSPNFKLRLSRTEVVSVTSAGGEPDPLPMNVSETIRRIDEVSIHTLRECMQTVFEDGPKRDRRLWIGDLRLQALANYATFRNFDLVKRCLYLFAGLPREDGLLAACIYEQPNPVTGQEHILDYAALYGATLLEYGQASDDWITVQDLWIVVKRQMEILCQYIDKNGLFCAPPKAWVFIDWCERLDRTATMHAVYVFALRQARELAERIGTEAEVIDFDRQIEETVIAARNAYFDTEKNLFVSGPNRQVSWATQAWMVISGIASRSEGRTALKLVHNLTDAVRPGAPYLYHYVIEALLICDMNVEAKALLESYWGSMVDHGADTFWEVYDPQVSRLSPYGNYLINSYCHAWSCTPTYLIRSCGLQ